MSQMTPREIVQELDKHIIGQDQAKRSVAIALRNRWRRMQVEVDLRNEITPKNILMMGPTGVGKTEIARRLARLANAPFIKVEATKFTEVGYVGREVDSIIRDLTDVAIKLTREVEMEKVTPYPILLLVLANLRKSVRFLRKRSQLSGDFHTIETYPRRTPILMKCRL